MLSPEKQNIILEVFKPWNPSMVGIFGSFARDEDGPGSDLDILVDFQGAVSLFDIIEMENTLSQRLNLKVDLVTTKAVSELLRPYIYRDLVRIA